MSEWFCHAQGRINGPYTPQQLKLLVEKGRLTPDSPIRKGVAGIWAPAAKVKGLFAAEVIAAFEADQIAVRAANTEAQWLQSQAESHLVLHKPDLAQGTPLAAFEPAASANEAALTQLRTDVQLAEKESVPLHRNPALYISIAIVMFAGIGISMLAAGILEVVDQAKTSDKPAVAGAEDSPQSETTAGIRERSDHSAASALTAVDGQSGSSQRATQAETEVMELADIASELDAAFLAGDIAEGSSPPGYQEGNPVDASSPNEPMGNSSGGAPVPSAAAPQSGSTAGSSDVEQPKPATPEEIYTAARHALVTVHSGPGQRGGPVFPGVLLYPTGLIVAQMIFVSPEMTVTFWDQKSARVTEVVRRIPETGLTFLRIDTRAAIKYPMLKIALNEPGNDDQVVGIFPGRRGGTPGETGRVSGVSDGAAGGHRGFEQCRILHVPFSSESIKPHLPVVNMEGELVGLTCISLTSRSQSLLILSAVDIARVAPEARPLTAAVKVEFAGAKESPEAALASKAAGSSNSTSNSNPSEVETRTARLIFDPQRRLAELERINERRQEILKRFEELTGQKTKYEQEIITNQIQYKQVAAKAVEYKVRGENVYAAVRLLQNQLANEKGTFEKERIRQDLRDVEFRFNELKQAYEECLKAGQKIELTVADLKSKIASAVKNQDELQAQGEKLRSDWLEQLDPYGQLPSATHQSSIDPISTWINQDPQFGDAYLARGFAYLNLNQGDKAIEDFGQAAEKETSSVALVRAALGLALSRSGQEKEAQAELAKALAKDKRLAVGYLFRGEHLLRHGKCKQAEDDFETATRLDENNPEAFRQLAWLQATCTDSGVRNGRRALEHAEKAQVLHGSAKDWRILMTLSAAQAEAGEQDKATVLAQQARAIMPADLSAELSQQLAQLEKGEPLRLE